MQVILLCSTNPLAASNQCNIRTRIIAGVTCCSRWSCWYSHRGITRITRREWCKSHHRCTNRSQADDASMWNHRRYEAYRVPRVTAAAAPGNAHSCSCDDPASCGTATPAGRGDGTSQFSRIFRNTPLAGLLLAKCQLMPVGASRLQGGSLPAP